MVLGILEALQREPFSALDAQALEVLRLLVVQRRLELPRLPALAEEIMALDLDGPEDSRRIAALVQTDRDVTACVMEAANAARFGVYAVRTLEHAIVRLGLRTVQSIAVGAASHRILYSIPGQDAEALLLAERAMECAHVCRELARPLRLEPGVAFLCGMFHDVGEVLLLRALSTVEAQAGGPPSPALVQRLRRELHVPLGGWFTQARAFHPVIQDAVLAHHGPVDALSGLVWAVQALQVLPPGTAPGEWHPLAPEAERVAAALAEVRAATGAG